MVKTTSIMALLTVTYMVLKFVMIYMANSAYNNSQTCETNGLALNDLGKNPPAGASAFAAPYTNEIVFYTSLLEQMALDVFRTNILTIVLVGLITMHYMSRKPYDKHKHKHVKLKISYYNFVTRPLVIAVFGIAVIVCEGYVLGEYMLVDAPKIGTTVNKVFSEPPVKAGLTTLLYSKQPECFSTSNINTLYKLAWASIAIFVAMMAVSHWSGFVFAYREKKDEVRAAKSKYGVPESGMKRSKSDESLLSGSTSGSSDSESD
jgi:hypothetical protein